MERDWKGGAYQRVALLGVCGDRRVQVGSRDRSGGLDCFMIAAAVPNPAGTGSVALPQPAVLPSLASYPHSRRRLGVLVRYTQTYGTRRKRGDVQTPFLHPVSPMLTHGVATAPER